MTPRTPKPPIDLTPAEIAESPPLAFAFAGTIAVAGPAEGTTFLLLYGLDAGGGVVGHKAYDAEAVRELCAFLAAWLRHEGRPTAACRAEMAGIDGVVVGDAPGGGN